MYLFFYFHLFIDFGVSILVSFFSTVHMNVHVHLLTPSSYLHTFHVNYLSVSEQIDSMLEHSIQCFHGSIPLLLSPLVHFNGLVYSLSDNQTKNSIREDHIFRLLLLLLFVVVFTAAAAAINLLLLFNLPCN